MSKKLDVRYFSQRDSKVNGQWYRSCYSSANAMMLSVLRPSALSDSYNADDEYLKRVLSYGDTTLYWAQRAALNSFGVRGELKTNASKEWIMSKIDEGTPVPIAILHKGTPSAPRGGGHWITVVGYTDRGFIVHDPYGELSLLHGYYMNADGKNQHYSFKNLLPRFYVKGTQGGWAIDGEKL